MENPTSPGTCLTPSTKKTGLSHEDGDYSITFGTQEGASSLMVYDGLDAYLMEGQDLTLKIRLLGCAK